jgi:hypothetical protein
MLDMTCRKWRELLQSADDVVPIDKRLAVSVPDDDIFSLIEFGVGTLWNRVTVDQIGWDIRRTGSTHWFGR